MLAVPARLRPRTNTWMDMLTTLALIDDHRLFREGVLALLASQPDFKVVAEASDAGEAYQVIAATAPDVVVLDLSLPGVSGLEVGRKLLQLRPRQRILALTMLRDQRHVALALEAGFLGYATKDQPGQELLVAIRAVANRQHYLSPSLSAGPADGGSPLVKLTRREREVFDLTVAGVVTAQIAEQLQISRRTVETHRARILHKLDAHSAVDLVRLAASLGLLPVDSAA